MKKFLICGLCVAALAACENKKQPMAEEAFKCGDANVAVKVYEDHIDATINGQEIQMFQVVTASGAKYQSADTKTSLWNKGENWMMLVGEETVIDCK
jgi:membrane-bound inhibitor of C-type lysozyme